MGGNTKGRRRRFGAVRRLASGRWQARYLGPDGLMRPADCTFASKTEAERWLVRVEGEIVNAEWIDPDAGKVPFADYADAWIAERPNLRPKTVQLYRYLLRCHLRPALGEFAVKTIGDAQVRRWRKELLDAGVSPVTAAKAYRLLKAILNTAVDDGLIRRNPCRIKGAGQEKSPERPDHHQPPGLADRRRDRSALPGSRSPGRFRQFALGRAGRASPLRYRPGGWRGPDHPAAERGLRTARVRAAQVCGRPPRGSLPRRDRSRAALASGPFRPARGRRPGVHEPGRAAASPFTVPRPRVGAHPGEAGAD